MPDHVHYFCSPSPEAKPLAAFIGAWKQWTSKRIKAWARTTHNKGGYSFGFNPEDSVWQREFFDHVLRSEESYSEKWRYVRDNPVRAGLVNRAEEWNFQGEIEVLRARP